MSDTTDDLTPDADALVSAYLDGEVTPEERALVEGNPVLLSEVDRLRQVRAVMGAVTEPPPISVREAHLAAALDVWDRMSGPERRGDVTPGSGVDAAAGAAIHTPAPTSLNARRRSGAGSSKWLLGAAAGLVVVVGAGVVLSNLELGSSDDDTASESLSDDQAEPASEADAVASDAANEMAGAPNAEVAPLEVASDDVESEDARTTADDAALADEPAAATEAAEAPAEEPAEEPADEDAAPSGDDPADGGIAQPPGSELELTLLQTDDELADFGALAAYAPSDPAGSDLDIELPFATCDDEFAGIFDFDPFAGPASYVGNDVIVGVDQTSLPGLVVAYTSDCEVVAEVPLPTRDAFDSRRSGG
ncbi:MAG: anti-sigma factor family protein [Ilumatobacter sp.]|jgi:hypothetical protein|uniref:anti-sigma factor family protein n=1 Tax=Ilumatobacter sp. TaxID=1967498 RepID=UPI00391A256F